MLLSVSPNSWHQGQQSLSIALTGQYSHWFQGTTTASFGTGITVTSLTVNSPTSATAIVTIDPQAALGARAVTIMTGTEIATLNNGFTVTAGTPVLVSVTPNGGQQGQQNLTVQLTGQYTHWVQGTTTTSFGTGITVASLAVNSPTTATAVLNIDAAAATSSRTVTVTTGSEIATLKNGLTVTAGTPVLVSVTPNGGQQGQQNLTVQLTGQYTHWVQGTTTVSFGAGVTMASLTVNSATSATAVVTIDPAAAVGSRTVTLTTGSEIPSLNNGFTVTAGTPVLVSVTPNSGQQGQQNVTIQLTGQYTHWVQGTTTASFGAGVTVASLSVNSPTSATAVLNIDAAAAIGSRTVTLTTGSEIGTLNNGFTVTAPVCIVPPANLVGWWTGDGNTDDIAGGDTGAIIGNVTFVAGEVGQAFKLDGGYTLVTSSPTAALNTRNAVTVDAWIYIEALAMSPGDQAVNHVIAGRPWGYQLDLSPTGHLNFAFPNAGGHNVNQSIYSISNIPLHTLTHVAGTYDSATGVIAVYINGVLDNTGTTSGLINSEDLASQIGGFDYPGLSKPYGAFNGLVDEVEIFDRALSGAEITAIYNAGPAGRCKPSPPPAALITVIPNTASQGQQNVSVAFTGQYTHWLEGVTSADFGSGITVASLTVNSPTTATAVLNIDPQAATGSRKVTMTTGTEVANGPNLFNVTGNVPTPVITQVVPNSGQQGQQNLTVQLTGQYTHWVQGTSTASFGAGITVASLTVNSPTSATTVLNIDPGAATGPRTVTLTTGSEIATLSSGFTVTAAGTPALVTVNPDSSQQGQQSLSVALTGQYTHWVQGTSTADFGAGMTVASLTVNSPTSATAVVNVDPAAATGTRTVTVTTGTEIATLNNGFTVSNRCLSPPSGMVGWWTGDGNTDDLAGGDTGVITGGVTYAPGEVGQAFKLDGGFSLVSATPTAALNIRTAITVDAWILAETFTHSPGDQGVGLVVAGRPWGYQLTLTTDGRVGLGFPINGGGHSVNQGVSSVSHIPLHTLTHVAGTYDSATGIIAVYINGVLDNTATASGLIDAADLPLQIGGFDYPGLSKPYGAFTGLIDEVEVFNRALSGSEIMAIYTAGTNGKCKSNTPPATLSSVAPNRAIQGQQTPVSLTGQYTHWVQGTTAVSFGDGISVQFLTINSPTTATGVLNIDSGAPSGPRTVTTTTGSEIATLNNGFTVLIGNGCIPPASGLVSWWMGDGNINDSWGVNNPSASNAISFVPGEVGAGFTFESGGYIDIPPSPSLANQQFTWSAWARPDGAGPNNDFIGNWIVGQDIDNFNLSVTLSWRATDNRFSFIFGNVSSEQIVSRDAFPPGQFYFVAATYDGATFTLFVNGQIEGTASVAKSIAYSPITWTIGSSSANIRGQSYPRTWNGVIDEVQAFNRALFQSEIQALYLAGGTGECKGQPAITSVSPSNGQQGQQNLTVQLTGQYTHWVQGTTTVDFGTGITLASLRVNSPTIATAVLNIDLGAATGPRTVIVTTGTEIETLNGGFTVFPTQGPVITTISPNFGQQGQNGPVTVVGQNTHFAQGVTQLDVGPGITVTDVVVTCPTCLTAHLSIAESAPTGAHDVTVTTGAEVAQLLGGFTVQPGTPILTSIVPAGGRQGQSLPINITGKYTHFAQGTTEVSLGDGITVTSVAVASSTSLTAQITIDANASPGTRTVTVTTGTEIVSVQNVFTIQPGVAVISSLTPNSAQQGQTLNVAIAGQYTHFTQGVSLATFGSGITVNSLTVSDSTDAVANITIDSIATPGLRTVTVTTGTEIASAVNAFTITSGTATLTQLNPNTGQQGQALNVAITGQSTHFAQGASSANFGAGTAVNSLTVTDATHAVANISIDPSASLGTRTVTVTTGGEIAGAANAFTVTAATAVITQAQPSSGQQGQLLDVVITGQYTHFAQGTSIASFGSDITVNSLTVASATQATANITISGTAALGARTVAVTTGTEVANGVSAFTVTGGAAVITQVSPNSGQQGQALNVAITGQSTHFVQGTSSANFGAGITVNSLTVIDATDAAANITISPAAAPGPRTITITTGAEVASGVNAFTVTSGTATISQLNPNNGQQGQALNVAITGQFTHFAQGVTSATFGAGITVNSLTVTDATDATANITISTTANTSVRSVTLTTGTEIVSAVNGFTITANNGLPEIISLTPNSALQGHAVEVTITGQNTNFQQGITQANFGPGVSVGNGLAGGYGPVQVVSSTVAIAELSITAQAPPGARTVVAQTGDEKALLINGFVVNGTPYLSSISPSSGQQGTQPLVTIYGEFTNFQQGVTQANFGAGISVGGGASGDFGPVTVTAPHVATAQLQIDAAASPGLRNPVVQTNTEQASLSNNGFLVLGPITGPPPVVTITSPPEGAEVTTQTTVTGTVSSPNLASWTLDYQSSGSNTFTPFATGTSPNPSGVLDPTLLLNGITAVRLTATDQSGQYARTVLNVVVTRNAKVGNFTVSFNDLTIPVAGLPIQIIRTYDSRNKSTGDFGFGWSLHVNTTKLDVNGQLGMDWTGTVSGQFIKTYCVQPAKNHVVSVRLPGGAVYKFQPSLPNGCQQAAPPETVDMAFTPTGATPANAVLTAIGGTNLFVSGSFPGSIILVDQNTVEAFDPDQFQLRMPDGRTLLVSRTFNLQSITDPNNNTLTFSANGIISSTGKGVSFQRDAQNRITSITDPAGNVLSYTYTGTGDLDTFTDQSNQVSSYGYDNAHYLLSIQDPRGIQPIRNVYDDSGRLIQETDAFGNVINFNHDLSTSSETVIDALGNPTAYVYDADGNVLAKTDALGNVTQYTYDARDNKLTETNALHKTTTYTYDNNNNLQTQTDPLGNTTTYTYNSLNEVLTVTDPNQHTTTNTYDGNGNLLTTTNALGQTTTNVYGASGLLSSTTDALGNVTQFAYDGYGNLTTQTDALGTQTTYTYDSNGNRTSQSVTRTTPNGPQVLLTQYQYDAQNRLVSTTFPDGTSTQATYNSIGKKATSTDELDRQTSYQYDLDGRLVQTAYPDGSIETFNYDANGHQIQHLDGTGITTLSTYDKLGRLVAVKNNNSGGVTQTAYDAIGQVSSTTDARSNVTSYGYDAAGRRTQVTDAMSHVTGFGYDAAGQQVSMTNANSHTTQYQYDAAGRRTQVIFPDATFEATLYDAVGRAAAKTDQAGKTTQYGYDKLGRLTSVTDSLSQITSYAYDEVGNRIVQTDANNHSTVLVYDQRGRRTGRMLPLGQGELFTYDAVGNMSTHRDFNGRTTNFSYDAANRLQSKVPDGAFNAPPVTFTYYPSGTRASMTDASGTSTYQYDSANRVVQITKPAGTLSYAYDLAGNLTSLSGGAAQMSYGYDQLNRLSTVVDPNTGQTTYQYDAVGNLASVRYPNGVTHAYNYDQLNRLKNLSVNQNATPLASYAYTLDPAGHRTSVSELTGRVVNYQYDGLYRLTSESITGDQNGQNGVIGYTYDPVGNRQQRTSIVPAIPAGLYNYDANDRLTSDSYDANGNTIASGGVSNSYDFENHLIRHGSVTLAYDGDGHRVSETANGVTTNYLVDSQNPTGYAQVLEEMIGGSVQRVYSYGLTRISQTQTGGTSLYGYDGYGNVRLLADAIGGVTDRYDYDAFGNLISQAGTTSNIYRYSGEQNDGDLNLYYLRDRYLATLAGRLWTSDTGEGVISRPLSLHQYIYAEDDPVNKADPSGDQALTVGGFAPIFNWFSNIFPYIRAGSATKALENTIKVPLWAYREVGGEKRDNLYWRRPRMNAGEFRPRPEDHGTLSIFERLTLPSVKPYAFGVQLLIVPPQEDHPGPYPLTEIPSCEAEYTPPPKGHWSLSCTGGSIDQTLSEYARKRYPLGDPYIIATPFWTGLPSERRFE